MLPNHACKKAPVFRTFSFLTNFGEKDVCISEAINAGMTGRMVFHLSMSVGHSSALDENGYAVSGEERSEEVAWTRTSGRVRLQRVPGKAMAFDEDFIDQVSGLSAAAGRRARPQR